MQTKQALKREWSQVDLTSEVAEIFLQRFGAMDEAETEAKATAAAARTQLRVAIELETTVRAECAAQTDSALYMLRQATESKRLAEMEKLAYRQHTSAEAELTARNTWLEEQVAMLRAELEPLRAASRRAEEDKEAALEEARGEAAAQQSELLVRLSAMQMEAAEASERAARADQRAIGLAGKAERAEQMERELEAMRVCLPALPTLPACAPQCHSLILRTLELEDDTDLGCM
jgi:uncharacterized protein (DUF3084 family)